MKKILLLSIMLASVNTVLLAEDNHLYIQPNAGETLVWSVPTLQKMTFQDGQVVLTKKDGTTAYAPIATVKRMYISTPSVEGVGEVKSALPCTWEGGFLRIQATDGTPVTIYNVAGTPVVRQALVGGIVDLRNQPSGLYIVNVGGKVFKTIKK